MTQVIRSVREWKQCRNGLHGSIGFIPTMGALHAGHLSLIEKSRAENDHTVVSIFVNPTQFNDVSDLAAYPRTWDEDLGLLRQAGADFLFYPSFEQLYPEGYRYRIIETEFSRILCGKTRPGHFDGVLTVVMKLLNIIGAERAYFGEKDYQQLLLVQGLADAFFLETRIVGCPTVRENDELAMSSRNMRLTADQRLRSAAFPRILRRSESPALAAQELLKSGFEVDYVEEQFGRRFGAVRMGEVRLIDNVEI